MLERSLCAWPSAVAVNAIRPASSDGKLSREQRTFFGIDILIIYIRDGTGYSTLSVCGYLQVGEEFVSSKIPEVLQTGGEGVEEITPSCMSSEECDPEFFFTTTCATTRI